ncbi:MAG: 50S ribosomal protein L22 [Spirochaetota bacterium]|nr:50S ribosomal protein L22 [Spirochaetota bacterium]
MEAYSLSKYNRISTKKLRRVALAVHELGYQQAVNALANLPQKGAKLLERTLKSAGANLLNKEPASTEDEWIIKEIQVNKGPHLKRIRPRARGRADRINKPTSHLRVVVAERES